MDGILKISGNYCFAPNMWQSQDPFFTGKVLVDDEGKFFGYIRMSEEQNYSIPAHLLLIAKTVILVLPSMSCRIIPSRARYSMCNRI